MVENVLRQNEKNIVTNASKIKCLSTTCIIYREIFSQYYYQLFIIKFSKYFLNFRIR